MKRLYAAFLCALVSVPLYAANTVVPGALSAPYPTLINIGVLWLVTGDDNRNARVAVEYRKQGVETVYHSAMDLQHSSSGHNNNYSNSDDAQGGTWENRFAGSIFDLRPNTVYDIHLVMTDSDNGATWKKDTVLAVKTRPVPRADSTCTINEITPGKYGVLNITSGTAAHPNVYRCTTGKATYSSVSFEGAQWVYLMNLTFLGDSTSNPYGIIHMRGAQNCVVSRCTLDLRAGTCSGITSYSNGTFGARNCYIADNVLLGPYEFIAGNMMSTNYQGIQYTGMGNVICYNYVKGFQDDIGTLEQTDSIVSLDMYNNDLYDADDDAIECDGTNFNCRTVRNRITNCFVAMSTQPARGGPAYFIRNVVYNNAFVSTKMNNRTSGNIWLHNTVIKLGDGLSCQDAWWVDNAIFRNNLAFGGLNKLGSTFAGYSPGPGMAMAYGLDTICSFDYDAVGTVGTTFSTQMVVEHPAGRDWTDIQHVEAHCVTNLDFAQVFPGVVFPDVVFPAYSAAPDLRPAAGSAVIDKGEVIPNINDGYTGSAPDCGAYEAGKPMTWYGPRPPGVDEESGDPTGIVQRPGARGLTFLPPVFSIVRLAGGFAVRARNIPGNADVRLFDMSGRYITTLISKSNGQGSFYYWDGTNRDGKIAAQGAYVIELSSGSKKSAVKVCK